MADGTRIVVDGANVAFIEPDKEGNPKVANLVKVCQELEHKGFKPIVIVDAALRHKVDEPDRLEKLIDDQLVHQAPAGTDADYFVIETAERYHAKIVTNDTYEEYQPRHKWLRDARVPLMIIHGKVELHEESLSHRNGHRNGDNRRENHEATKPTKRPANDNGR